MKILLNPDPALRVKCKAVDKITPELKQIAQDMYKVMKDAGGIGLAANQVGLDIRLLVIDNDGVETHMFNPMVLKRSLNVQIGSEGCLSFPGEFCRLKRPMSVTVKFRNINGKMEYKEFQGLQARALIHEMDHLDGKLFIDYEVQSDLFSIDREKMLDKSEKL